MASLAAQPFRFMDLPGELRNQVYGLLLCSFGPPAKSLATSRSPLVMVGSHVDTAILLTSRRVHREAYDVMVKVNRFIVVHAAMPLPLSAIMRTSNARVLSMDAGHISQFKGSMLDIELFSLEILPNPPTEPDFDPPMSAMLLADDLWLLCTVLNRACCSYPGFSSTVIIDAKVAPLVSEPRSPYKDAFNDFLSGEVQRILLAPFAACIRGFVYVCVYGYVSPELASATMEEMCKAEWLDPTQLLNELQCLKQRAGEKWAQGLKAEAAVEWFECLSEIGRIRRSTSWDNLVLSGGDSFFDKLIELRFLSCLNYVQFLNSALSVAITSSDVGNVESIREEFANMAQHTFCAAEECTTKGEWQKDRTWAPSNALLAKLQYRQAFFLYIHRDAAGASAAVDMIIMALRLLPNDTAIQESHAAILRWYHSVGSG